MNEATQTDAVW